MTWSISSNFCPGPAQYLTPAICWHMNTHGARAKNAAARGVFSIEEMLTTAERGSIDGCQTLCRNAAGPSAFMGRMKGLS
jgi:hypothetical protein